MELLAVKAAKPNLYFPLYLNGRFYTLRIRQLFFMAVAIVAAFSIAVAVAGPLMTTTPAMAQNLTGDNATAMAGNMTAANQTAGNWTK